MLRSGGDGVMGVRAKTTKFLFGVINSSGISGYGCTPVNILKTNEYQISNG